MKVINLKLYLCKRLFLTGISLIDYSPESENQIIMGTNGSGKSSLLDQLTPFFPDRTQMLEHGYKIITLLDKNILYRLESHYGKKNAKHSFFIINEDGTEINVNTGGTGAAQKTLIEQYFGITETIMDIWLGRTKFTTMPPIKRRDLILNLSGNQLDIAMKAFKKSKNELNDAKSVERHFIKRLSEETNDVQTQDELAVIEEKVERLTKELHNIFTQKDNNIPSIHTIQLDIEKLQKDYFEKADKVKGLNLIKPKVLDKEAYTLEDCRVFLEKTKQKHSSLKVSLEKLYEQQEQFESTLKAMDENGVTDVEDIKQQKENLAKEIEDLKKQTPIYDSLEDVDIGSIVGEFITVRPYLVDALVNLPDNSDQHITRDKARETRGNLNLCDQKLSQKNGAIKTIQDLLKHYEHQHDQTCPSCKFVFKEGFTQFSKEDEENKLKVLIEEVNELEETRKPLISYIEEANAYAQQSNILRKIFDDHPNLKALWDLMLDEGLYRVSPTIHQPTIARFGEQLENCKRIRSLTEKFNYQDKLMQMAETAKLQNQNFNTDYLQSIGQQIHDVIEERALTEQQGREVNYFYKRMEHLTRTIGELTLIKDKMVEKSLQLMESLKNHALSMVARDKQLELANASAILTQNTRHEAIVRELETEKSKATERHKDYANITNAISPVDGLISEYIQSAFDAFVGMMNDIIEDIWTYPMEILSCSVDSNDVTCKFPLSFNNGYLITADVSMASSGQKDFIDFVFKMIVGRYIGLSDLPLYLDELAPTLDEQHRVNITRYINDLMETGNFVQMYYISHYSANHYSFPNSEYLVMDERNLISKPAKFNTHVKIEYSTNNEPA